MKGLGRSAALLGLAGAASVMLTIGGPGLGVAQALDDGGRKDNGILDDKNRDCLGKDGKDRKDGKDGRDGGILGDDRKDGDWFKDGILDDKRRDNCAVGVGVVGVGVGGGGAGAPGGVAAGGGGMAANSTPMLPLAGAGLGAILLTVGVANRRRSQGAS